MTDRVPLTTSAPDWDRALGWMVLVSGAVHLAGIALILLVPHSFLHQPQPLLSYTVDLVAPDRVGGNNVVQGGKGRVDAAPLAPAAPAPKVEPPKPPPPKVEEAKPPEPKPEPPKPKEPEPQVAAKPEPKPEPPKVEEKPKEDEVALADKAKKAEPSPLPTAPQQVPSPQAKPAPSPKVIAKVEPAKPPPAPAQPKVDPKAAKEAAAAKERDDRIASAIKRVEQQTGKRGGGSGAKAAEQPGGPLSVGPGEGAGGAVMGVEYLIYRNQLESRIKQNWAWAGNRSLEAAIHFSITEGGDVVDVRITKSSGDSSYDASIERAVRALNPLPPPPQQYRKQFSDVEYTFTPESLQM